MANLYWRDPTGESQIIELSSESSVIGRDPSADCRLLYRGISRRHARIGREGQEYFLEDLGSTNGTIVNGSRLQKKIQIHSGDRIQIGRLVLEFDATGEKVLVTEPLSRTLKYENAVKSGVEPENLPERLPRPLGKFRLLEKLGQGGMGAVYRAFDTESNQEVALKLIRRNIGHRESFLEFFHNREAVLAREIDHPNVVRVYEHGVEKEQHYIEMEYIRGENLYKVMKRRRLRPEEILEILRQVACGVAAAHKQGVVHSDIKPANVMIVEGAESLFFAPAGVIEHSSDDIIAGDILEFDDSDEFKAGMETALKDEIHRRTGEKRFESLDDPPYYSKPSESRFLLHYLERMKESRGFFVLLEGERGVGKRRLISEFLLDQKSIASGMLSDLAPKFFELDCSRIEGIPLLYEQIAGRMPSVDNNLRQMLDEILLLTGGVHVPIVIRVIDFGKASPLVCYLLGSWVRRMGDQPILLLASVDPEVRRGNRSVDSLLEMSRHVLKELYLRPLTEYQIQRYLEILLPDKVPESLAENVYRLSGGNFSRIFDLLHSFFERGILRCDLGTGEVTYHPSLREFELEEGKNLYEKYRAYGKLEQRILEYAAFIGNRFFFDALLRFHNVDETALFFVVRQLLGDEFFTEDSPTWYRFTNDSFRRYMAERIPLPERPHLHRKLTRILQAVPVPESPELFQLRGNHFAGCKEYSKAVQNFLEGAHLARNEYLTDLAIEMSSEIIRIYRELSKSEGPRREVTSLLKNWFRRDGNWYEILSGFGAQGQKALVKITDFGISFRTADEERGYQVGRRPVMGTPRYIAPERGKNYYGGPPSDVFSLGIIAYEMVVGRAPFPGLKRRRRLRAYQTKPIRISPENLGRFPPGFGDLITGMLAIDPDRRWDAERVIREIVKLQFDISGGNNGSEQ